MNNITQQTTIGLVIAKNIKAAQIFDEYGVNIGRENTTSIAEVCEKHNIECDEVLSKISKLPPPLENAQPDFLNMPLDELTQYIVKNHHKFLYQHVPEMEKYLEAAVEEQKNEFPALTDALKSFKDFEEIMYRHLKLEEKEYFPFVCDMVKIANKEAPFQGGFEQTAEEYIETLVDDHRRASKLVNKTCRFVKYKNPPKNAGENYIKFIQLVNALHQDIFLHITLEDSVLQPKSIILEQQLNALQKYGA